MVTTPGLLESFTWEGMMIWADAVREAGSLDRMKLIEVMESGKTYDMPAGQVSIDPKTHHIVQDVYLAELKDQKFNVLETYPRQPPADTDLVCDLIANPNDASFYFENGLEAAGIK